MLLQTWMTLNSKEDILKNVDNQTIVIPIQFFLKSMGAETMVFNFLQKKLKQVWNGFSFLDLYYLLKQRHKVTQHLCSKS